MLPSSNQTMGMNTQFPDICLTPAAPSPVPIPYPNLGQNSTGMPFCPTILLSFAPAHSMSAKPMITNGDEAGCSHATFIGGGANNMGNPRILLQGMPAETLVNPTAGNKYNAPLGAKLVPSVTNCLMGASPGEGALALAAEMLDLRCSGPGLTLEREPAGWRVLQARRGGRASRAGVRPGELVVKAGPAGLEVRSGRRTRCLSLPAATGSGPVVARLRADGVGVLVVRRCSLGAPRAAAAALRALEAAGARSLVLDLRGNPGGDLRAAAALAGLLLGASPFAASPLPVLVDAGTASAAELLAAALCDAGRAVLAGRPTHGKLQAREHALTAEGLVPRGPELPMRTASGARLGALRPELPLAAGLDLAARAARRRPA